jgi:hypothetical protein
VKTFKMNKQLSSLHALAQRQEAARTQQAKAFLGMEHNPKMAGLVSRPSLGCMYRPGIVDAPVLRSYNRMMGLVVGSAAAAGLLVFGLTRLATTRTPQPRQ